MAVSGSAGLLLAVVGNALWSCSYFAVLLSRRIVHFDWAHLRLHRCERYRESPWTRHHLRLLRPHRQKLELHRSSTARPRDLRRPERPLDFKPDFCYARIVGQAFPPAALFGSATGNGCPTKRLLQSNPSGYAAAYSRTEGA